MTAADGRTLSEGPLFKGIFMTPSFLPSFLWAALSLVVVLRLTIWLFGLVWLKFG